MDPVIAMTARLALALLFAAAARHKFADLPRFEAIVANYKILPARGVTLAARAALATEIALAATLPLPSTAALAGAAAAALLLAYAAAIGLNLARGRREIDCGCGGADDQPLRPALLARNGLLVVVAAACALPIASRPISALDGFTVVVGVSTLALLWQAGSQLLARPLSTRSTRSTRRRLAS
jgi:hypothetical protein